MSSAIDPNVPPQGSATTAAVRANFLAAKQEIEAIQALLTGTGTVTIAALVCAAIGTGGATDLTFSSSGGNTLKLAHLASAVNNIVVKGGPAAGYPDITVEGSDTDIGIEFISKGSGRFDFYTNAASPVRQFSIIHVASAVNYWQLNGQAAAGTPSLQVTGNDTNISANYGTKGSGSHLFLTNGNATLQVEISHTASATRRLILTGSNGGNPTINTSAGDLAITPAIVGAAAAGNALGIAASATTALNLPAGTTGVSSIRLAHGAAPSSPVNGDMWTTTAGLFVRINGSTVGPLS